LASTREAWLRIAVKYVLDTNIVTRLLKGDARLPSQCVRTCAVRAHRSRPALRSMVLCVDTEFLREAI